MSVWLELKPEPTLFLATLLDLYYMEPFYGLELFCITCLFGEYIYIAGFWRGTTTMVITCIKHI